MKALELNRIEQIEGGSQRDCLLRGYGLAAAVGLALMGQPAGVAALIVLGTTSGHCY